MATRDGLRRRAFELVDRIPDSELEEIEDIWIARITAETNRIPPANPKTLWDHLLEEDDEVTTDHPH